MGPATDWLMCRPPGLGPCSAKDPVVDTAGSNMPPSELKKSPSKARRGRSYESKKTAWHLNPPSSPFGNAEDAEPKRPQTLFFLCDLCDSAF